MSGKTVPTPAAERERPLPGGTRRVVVIFALFLVLLGARAAVIHFGANVTPLGDEWDGDATRLLKPYLEGSLRVGDLFRYHNEHIIFFTRLLGIVILNVSGYWDVVLQMLVNAVLDAGTVVLISAALARVLPGYFALASMILCVLVNVVPLSWENILLGFNTHFYLLLSCSFAGLWLLARAKAWSPRWALGTALAGASILCMASGALTPAAAVGLHGLQVAQGRRRGAREWLGVVALIALTIVLLYVAFAGRVSGGLGAHSSIGFLRAFLQLTGWPLFAGLGALAVAPSLAFCILTVADNPPLGDPRWFNVGGYGWLLTQCVAFAVGRAELGIQNRYTDALLVGLMISVASALWLTESLTVRRKRIWPYLCLAAWLAIVAASLAHAVRHAPGDIDLRRRTAAVQEENVRGYLATGDVSHLAGVPLVDIPYFESEGLQKMLDDPEIRGVLPPALRGRGPPQTWVEAFKTAVLDHGVALIVFGFLLLIAAVVRGRAPSAPGASC